MIHPGEFGVYREKIVSELLKPFLPSKYSIGTGFIITNQNHVSTQCDLIIYDSENTPVIENEEQRFFPVECVVGVIEVKSKLTKSQLKEALIKLSKVKKLREDIGSHNPYVFKDGNYNGFDSKRNPRDQIATFLVCEKFEFNLESCQVEFFNDVYAGIDKSQFHNMILSLNDGVCLYHDGTKVFYHPYIDYTADKFKYVVLKPHEKGYKSEHVLLFVDYFYMIISSISVMYVEITLYVSQNRIKRLVF